MGNLSHGALATRVAAQENVPAAVARDVVEAAIDVITWRCGSDKLWPDRVQRLACAMIDKPALPSLPLFDVHV
jgi:hypothetical protein